MGNCASDDSSDDGSYDNGNDFPIAPVVIQGRDTTNFVFAPCVSLKETNKYPTAHVVMCPENSLLSSSEELTLQRFVQRNIKEREREKMWEKMWGNYVASSTLRQLPVVPSHNPYQNGGDSRNGSGDRS